MDQISSIRHLCRCRPCLCHNRFPFTCPWLRNQEHIRNTVTDIYGIHFFGLPWSARDTLFLYKLFVRFIYTDNGGERIRSSAMACMVQREEPSGGEEQAMAQIRASTSPVTLRLRVVCFFLSRAADSPSMTNRFAIPAIVLWETPNKSNSTLLNPMGD